MSHTTSVRLGRSQCVVAIAGATGGLGNVVSRVFLSPGFRPFFSRIICLTRNAASDTAKSLAEAGGELHEVSAAHDHTLREVLKGVDVVINALGSDTFEMQQKLVEAAVGCDVKVYFPSEFGVDHRANDFDGFDHPDWAKKRIHLAHAKDISGGRMKIVSIYVGLFLEGAIALWSGFDTANKKYIAVGSSSAPLTFTSKADIGRALAQLCILSSSSAMASTVPEHVRISGTIKSMQEIKSIIEKENGSIIEIETVELGPFREQLKQSVVRGEVGKAAQHIRVLMGEGKLDFKENHNELVNPHESVWTWKTMEEYAIEMKGKGGV